LEIIVAIPNPPKSTISLFLNIPLKNMNETSSRAHTIVRLHFQQKSPKGLIKASQINLVDLAGSERQKKGATSNGRGRRAGAEGKASAERQKEGIRINLSLSTLGRVMHGNGEGEGEQWNGVQSVHAGYPSIA
jgi:hypothetical protein